MDILGLSSVADALTGDVFKRGISGGQRKRVNSKMLFDTSGRQPNLLNFETSYSCDGVSVPAISAVIRRANFRT